MHVKGLSRGSQALGVALVLVSTGLAGCGGASSDAGSSEGRSAASPSATTAGVAPASAPSASAGSAAAPRPNHSAKRATTAHRALQAHHRTTATSPQVHSRFVHYADAAFRIFHQRVYEPLVAGSLTDRAHRRRAGSATVAAYRQLLRAKSTALAGTTLRQLYAPLAGLQAILGDLSVRLNAGRASRADVYSANSAIAGIERIASSAGVRISEEPVAATR
jgi:hypothetical protein